MLVLMWGINVTLDIVTTDRCSRTITCTALVPHAYTCKNNMTCIIHDLTGLVLIQTESHQFATEPMIVATKRTNALTTMLTTKPF